MKIKVGDNVRVISGDSKGKEGKIIRVLRKENRVVVEGINIVKKTMKARNANETGGIIEVEAPIHISNIKKLDKVSEKKVSSKKETVKPSTKKTVKTTKNTSKKESKESK